MHGIPSDLRSTGPAPAVGGAKTCRKDALGRRKQGAFARFPAGNCRKLSKTVENFPTIAARWTSGGAFIALIWHGFICVSQPRAGSIDVENFAPGRRSAPLGRRLDNG